MGLEFKVGHVPSRTSRSCAGTDDSGDFVGFFADVLKTLAQNLNFTFSVSGDFSSFGLAEGALVRGVADGVIDIAADCVSITSQRSNFVDFAYPVYNQDAV